MNSETRLLRLIKSDYKFNGISINDFHFNARKSKKGADKKLKMRHTIYRGALSVQEAAEYLSVGKNTIYHLIYSAELASFKIGGRRLIAKNELKRFIKVSQLEAQESAMKGVF